MKSSPVIYYLILSTLILALTCGLIYSRGIREGAFDSEKMQPDAIKNESKPKPRGATDADRELAEKNRDVKK